MQVVNQNTIMSALKETVIHKLIINLQDEIIDDLTLNWKEYGINEKTDLDTVEGLCKRTAYPALMRSKEGGERRFLGTTTVETINSSPRSLPNQKPSFLSKFKL